MAVFGPTFAPTKALDLATYQHGGGGRWVLWCGMGGGGSCNNQYVCKTSSCPGDQSLREGKTVLRREIDETISKVFFSSFFPLIFFYLSHVIIYIFSKT